MPEALLSDKRARSARNWRPENISASHSGVKVLIGRKKLKTCPGGTFSVSGRYTGR